MSSHYSNPIIPGFAPDPSVVFVDGLFFLVNSSFHVFPGIPVYVSKNLKSWTHIGNAINRRDQLSLTEARTSFIADNAGKSLVAVGGLYAPTIRHHDGIFYIICTNICGDGLEKMRNFYISTADIWSDSWSQPIYFDHDGFDPSVFFDDDGKVYVQGCIFLNTCCTIGQFEIDIKTGRHVTDRKIIWDGHAKTNTEGPHVYKKDGFYYLLVAEGGTFKNHMMSIARSKNIWGPFESYEQNPILSADGTDRYIQNTGHADLFQDADHEWWAVALGVRNFEDQGRFPMGRESFLTHVTWPEDGWPKVAAIEMDMERKGSKVLALKDALPKFEQPDRVNFVYIRDPDLENYKFSEGNKDITFTSSTTDLSSPSGTCSFVGKRQRAFDSTCMVELSVSTETAINIEAGLAAYKDDFRYARIYLDGKTSRMCFQAINKAENVSILEEVRGSSGRCVLKIRSTPTAFEFSYREATDGSLWHQLGSVDSKLMTGYDFTGTIFGIFATHGSEGKATAVEFKSFSLD